MATVEQGQRVYLVSTNDHLYGIEEDGPRARVVSMDGDSTSDTPPARRRPRRPRMPWWGHVLMLTLIIGGTGISVVVGNPGYAWVCVVSAWIIGYLILRNRNRRTS